MTNWEHGMAARVLGGGGGGGGGVCVCTQLLLQKTDIFIWKLKWHFRHVFV